MNRHLRIRVLPASMAIAVVAIAGAVIGWRAATDPFAHEHSLALLTAPLPAVMAALVLRATALPPVELTASSARSPRSLAVRNLSVVMAVAALGLSPLASIARMLPPEPLASSYGFLTAVRNLIGMTGAGLLLARVIGVGPAGLTLISFSMIAQLYGRPSSGLNISWWAFLLQPTGHVGALIAVLAVGIGGAFALRGPPLPR